MQLLFSYIYQAFAEYAQLISVEKQTPTEVITKGASADQ